MSKNRLISVYVTFHRSRMSQNVRVFNRVCIAGGSWSQARRWLKANG